MKQRKLTALHAKALKQGGYATGLQCSAAQQEAAIRRILADAAEHNREHRP